jgi:type IV pilus assembly protein PilC
VYKSVESGSTLSDAFRKEETIFSELQINLLVAGEKSGQLNEVMEQIAIDLRKEKDLQSKIKGAMIYPVIIFIVMILVMVVMMLFMIPSVKDLYENFDAELPWITQALVTMSEGLSSPVGLISLVLVPVIVFFGFRYYYSTPSGRHVLDKLLLKIPVFGNLTTKVQLTQFNRLLSMLMKSGVPIVEELRIVAKSLSNIWFQELVMQASAEVTKGKSITIPLSKSKIFPVIMLKMLATGEETGKLDQITADMAEYYEKEVDDLTSNLTKLMEPFILLIVGGMVAFMAVAIYLPLYDLGQAANM